MAGNYSAETKAKAVRLATDARGARRAAVRRPGGRPGYRQGDGGGHHPGASATTPGRRQQETRSFGTTRAELESLAGWLASWGVTKAGMEATGVLLEAGVLRPGSPRPGLRAVQRRARQGAARPPEDRADAVWLAKITERGLVRASFVPLEPIRRLRTCTRYRRHLTQARTAEKLRVEKLLEDDLLTELPDVAAAQEAQASPGQSPECPKDADRQAMAAMSQA